jgi:hypothetical protein
MLNDGSYKFIINHELNDLIKKTNIIRFVKNRIIPGFVHVIRMEDYRIPKRFIIWMLEGE